MNETQVVRASDYDDWKQVYAAIFSLVFIVATIFVSGFTFGYLVRSFRHKNEGINDIPAPASFDIGRPRLAQRYFGELDK